MLASVKFSASKVIYNLLSQETKERLCNPKEKAFVEQFFGTSKIRVLTHGIMEIAYREETGIKDGNWIEYTTWTGVTDEMMEDIKQAMLKYGWKPGMRQLS